MAYSWWKESVVYQIYPRSFADHNGDGIGDIQGITSKLDYLQKLGVDVVWLSPVYQSPNDDNGYDISDYRKIMDEFGTMEDWEEMLEEMHKRGIRLIMDLVVNHTSDEHAWFIESRQSKDNGYSDYYIWRDPVEGREPNNWGSVFSGSAWTYEEERDQYYLHLFSEKQPDLNWENPQLREEIYNMMRFWLEKGIDGFRMDVINMISKHPSLPDGVMKEGEKFGDFSPYVLSGPRIHEFLHEMNQEVLAGYDVMAVGEMPGVTPEQAIDYTAEDREELHMVFTFEHMDLDHGDYGKWSLNSARLTDLKHTLTRWQKGLEKRGWNSLYWNNHDQPRAVSRFGDDSTYRVESAKMLATTLHMMKGTPFVYQGEEIGMTNAAFQSIDDYNDIETINMYKEQVEEYGEDPEEVLKRIHFKSRDNARTPMQWNTEAHAGFTTGTPWLAVNPNYQTINVEQAEDDPDSVLHYYKKLIQLRKNYPIIVEGNYHLLNPEDEHVFAYMRETQGEFLLVVSNFTSEEQLFTMPISLKGMDSEILITNYYKEQNKSTLEDVPLSPYETNVYLGQK